ncbi:dithiol-disulfide isomerase involved in polyketide biosynthesis [Vibrio sp. B1FLJ16]|uniref:DsbA family oxidoreductase n=1 Tax=Vibrio sp. B1FLJ16 TaxID=2751178 RepID=UPI0015F394B6|nr:DsbA family oxidoreductase [Vibrio sp. B1FLJ16]CAD7817965.1 dithiol-disulfide isomerase involved in polyketide biosynthesis [Vibrio sp. B1FLJ16]CAE6932872.1 dithiol-disulfide isomerase involved in polyketide biosynthesis [Vibrio sp. B1FLJ16]
MNNRIKLDIISDVVCPWCVIGYKHLMAAIDELGIQDKVDIEWQPFELNPDMPAEGEGLREHIARKYGASKQDSDKTQANITEQGAKYGFEFNYFDEMKMVNTLDAHVLLDLARDQGKQTELKLRLFSAFFSERKDISDLNTLLDEAEKVGMFKQEVMQALSDTAIREKIRSTEAQWYQMGISSVPTVIFNRKTALTGAHPQESYKRVLKELLQEAQS